MSHGDGEWGEGVVEKISGEISTDINQAKNLPPQEDEVNGDFLAVLS